MRYIDADAMLSKVKVNDDLVGKIDGKTLKAWIDSQPTVDVAPVIHAHWINHFDDLYPVESTIECSNCHEEQMNLLDDNYCPNCGAKMDEEKEYGFCPHSKNKY